MRVTPEMITPQLVHDELVSVTRADIERCRIRLDVSAVIEPEGWLLATEDRQFVVRYVPGTNKARMELTPVTVGLAGAAMYGHGRAAQVAKNWNAQSAHRMEPAVRVVAAHYREVLAMHLRALQGLLGTLEGPRVIPIKLVGPLVVEQQRGRRP